MKTIKLNSNSNTKTLPTRHLSARVPWHDNRWNGKTCCNVLDNSFCRILPLVDKRKDPETEKSDQIIHDSNFPPCISEKGTFLSPTEYIREVTHAWRDINPMFKQYGSCQFHHKPYSFNAIPFLWMMKSSANPNYDSNPADLPHKSIKARQFEVDYKIDNEAKIDTQLGFEGNIWVQDPHNQKALLDTFFGCLQAEKSLIFFYAKHTPLSEPNERVIVGVAKVRKNPGSILEYAFPSNYNGHRSYPWDRCIEHTLRENNEDGFLLPYHEILDYIKQNNIEIDLNEFIALAPDYEQFSYAAELVEHDTAIDALLNIAESLRKARTLLKKSFQSELNWIDREIAKIWDMRGAFPGLGPVLSALKIESGNTIAWEIEKYILNKDQDLLQINPWQIFEESLEKPDKYLILKGSKLFTSTVKTIWTNKPKEKKQFYKFLSRLQLSNEQAEFLLKNFNNHVKKISVNPYLLYEETRFDSEMVSFQQIDKAVFPPEKVRTAFPHAEGVEIDNQLDERRVRALSIFTLEDAAKNEGHSLLPFDDFLIRLQSKQLDEPLPIDDDTLLVQAEDDFFAEEINYIPQSPDSPISFLKLLRLQKLKQSILKRVNLNNIFHRPYNIDKNWLDSVNNYIDIELGKPLDTLSQNYSNEIEARYEKAMALRV